MKPIVSFLSFICALHFSLSTAASEEKYSELTDLPDTGSYFIELTENPLLDDGPTDSVTFQTKRKKLSAHRSKIKQKIADLLDSPPTIRHEYDLFLHGFSAKLSSETIRSVRKIKGIKKVEKIHYLSLPKAPHPPKKFSLDREETLLPALDVPKVWEKHGVRGEGIRIAVLDTGIDYRHPDLGGCFGEGCKVAGGYDFVNKDKDPIDDHGHGTHVAGIAAGDGKKLGVAPKATLYAYKVCDRRGRCREDDVIKALEHAIDPHGKGTFKDAVDVINMSFGGDDYNELPGRIINEASRYAIPVASAGNSGGLRLIGTPAAATHTIAVAASNGEKKIVPFSNVGPTARYEWKPDIAAPGYRIKSTFRNGEYRIFSGTSMAAPFIAGMSALLLQHKKDLTRDKIDVIKASLGSSAKTLPFYAFGGVNEKKTNGMESYFYQGHGLVQPLAAMSSTPIYHDRLHESVAPHSHKSELGPYFNTDRYVQRAIALELFCAGKLEGNLKITAKSFLGPGAQVNVEPKTVKCTRPKQWLRLKMQVRQRIDNIPFHPNYPHATGALLEIKNEKEQLVFSKPVSLFVLAKYQLKLKRSERLFNSFDLLEERTGTRHRLKVEYDEGDSEWLTVEKKLTPGKYAEVFRGAHTAFHQPKVSMWIKSGIKVYRSFERTILAKDLKHKKTFKVTDPEGNTLSDSILNVTFMSPRYPSGWSRGKAFIAGSHVELRMTSVPKDFHDSIRTFWVKDDKVGIILDAFQFNEKEEVIALPKSYTSVRFDPKFKSGWPKEFGFNVFAKRNNRSTYTFQFPTLASQLFIGKTNMPMTGFGGYIKPQHTPVGEDCAFQPGFAYMQLGLSASGVPSLANTEHENIIPTPKKIDVGQHTPFFTGRHYVNYPSRSFLMESAKVAFRWGLWGRNSVCYKLTHLDTNTVVEEGITNTWKTLRDLKPGNYALHRKLHLSQGALQSETTFAVTEQSTPSRLGTPILHHFNWTQESDGKINVYLTHPHYPSQWVHDPLSEVTKVQLHYRPRGSETPWLEWPLERMEKAKGVWKGTQALKLKPTEYELKIHMENKAGHRYTMTHPEPFYTYQ